MFDFNSASFPEGVHITVHCSMHKMAPFLVYKNADALRTKWPNAVFQFRNLFCRYIIILFRRTAFSLRPWGLLPAWETRWYKNPRKKNPLSENYFWYLVFFFRKILKHLPPPPPKSMEKDLLLFVTGILAAVMFAYLRAGLLINLAVKKQVFRGFPLTTH